MNENSPSSVRLQAPMSLKLQAISRADGRKTQGFCTVYVGPPAPVQNFSRRNLLGANNFQRRATHARTNPRCKTQKTTSAAHYCTKHPQTNAQKYHQPNRLL